MKAGTPVMAVARTPADCEPKAVTFEPELVTAPLMFALVVTVAAVPPILSEEVAMYARAVPSAFE